MYNVLVVSLSTLVVLCSVSASGNQLSSRELDSLLHEHAFEAFVGRPKTGVAYDANLTGIRVSAMRLKSGSLMRRGVSMYHEFHIPKGVVTHPYVHRLALLYHSLPFNWSLAYYPLHGYTYLAPVLGLLAYDANSTATRLCIRASAQPISIHFSHLLLPSVLPKCVFFDVNGSVSLSNMSSGNICTTFSQGHFSVVMEETRGNTSSESEEVWKIVCGVLALVVVMGLVGVLVGAKRKQRKRMRQMEMVAESSEALNMTAIGTTKAPAAVSTRTLPKIETDYVP
ncbi:uncharacterized protein LOC131018683 [Salvia miltiorrhiza]|uniref:uncharacterized protein LOC131018683 n=1 Tax=Salvia miltiorrhiza TaxID=226208 RepID=UPI0025ACD443|nr:uncharacterized protein LOC131018683 [Salvia miltiorrhiza]